MVETLVLSCKSQEHYHGKEAGVFYTTSCFSRSSRKCPSNLTQNWIKPSKFNRRISTFEIWVTSSRSSSQLATLNWDNGPTCHKTVPAIPVFILFLYTPGLGSHGVQDGKIMLMKLFMWPALVFWFAELCCRWQCFSCLVFHNSVGVLSCGCFSVGTVSLCTQKLKGISLFFAWPFNICAQPFRRYVQIGRVCQVSFGPDYGKLCVIIDVLDAVRSAFLLSGAACWNSSTFSEHGHGWRTREYYGCSPPKDAFQASCFDWYCHRVPTRMPWQGTTLETSAKDSQQIVWW